MEDAKLIATNSARLALLHKPFAVKISAILSDLRSHGYRPRIQESYRSKEDQRIAYDTGHSKLLFGFHNITDANGVPASCAVDLIDDNDPSQEKTRFFLLLASSAWKHELKTGTLWGLTERQKNVVRSVVASKEWDKVVRLGWDAGHIEPSTTLTPKAYQDSLRKG